MKEIVATISFLQEDQKKSYKHTKVLFYTRGNVNFYQFYLDKNQFTIAIFQDKVYIYSLNSLQYKLKLQLKKELKNLIYTPYGKLTAYTQLQKLNHEYMTKHNLILEYNLIFSGFKQCFYLHLNEE